MLAACPLKRPFGPICPQVPGTNLLTYIPLYVLETPDRPRCISMSLPLVN